MRLAIAEKQLCICQKWKALSPTGFKNHLGGNRPSQDKNCLIPMREALSPFEGRGLGGVIFNSVPKAKIKIAKTAPPVLQARVE
jgi:hypothetical protein